MLNNTGKLEKIGMILVLLMILLQGFYGSFAFIDPAAFADVRGTLLASELDTDWVMIYGSRTLFITLVLGYLLFKRQFSILMWCALFGTIMPITDGLLAYWANAPFKVVAKHIATVAYLLVTFVVLKNIAAKKV